VRRDAQEAGSVVVVEGRGIPLRGDDIDTDRIMPARFLRATSFEGLERHLFEDDRAARPDHPFNDARFAGATLLVVNRNFGCGSSREHAPQGLARAGIRGVIGESFSEIFQGNAAMLGVPCFATDRQAIERLQTLVEHTPNLAITARVDSGLITAGPLRLTATLPAALRDGFLSGQWNPTAMLLERFDEVRAVAVRLPYLNGFEDVGI
jgi:3-isopropylmalate/(R)-2-methylmalate dehydratase small subunit